MTDRESTTLKRNAVLSATALFIMALVMIATDQAGFAAICLTLGGFAVVVRVEAP